MILSKQTPDKTIFSLSLYPFLLQVDDSNIFEIDLYFESATFVKYILSNHSSINISTDAKNENTKIVLKYFGSDEDDLFYTIEESTSEFHYEEPEAGFRICIDKADDFFGETPQYIYLSF